MPDELKIIWILAVGLGLACAMGYLTLRLRLSPILGYLVAGYLIGPNSPGYIADQHISNQLANIGVTLLMFAVGLNFNWKEITAFRNIVVTGGSLLSLVCIFAGIALGIALENSVTVGFVIGVAVCVSSTVVIVRVLSDQNLLHTRQGHIVVGWSIVEDLISVLGLILLPALVVGSASLPTNTPTLIFHSVSLVLLKVVMLGLIMYFIGEKLIEKVLKIIARTRSHELFTLAILAIVFLIAVTCSYYFGISIALGAFIAGTVVGKTSMSHQVAADALPMRDAFSVVFFLSVGMLFNPLAIQHHLPLFLGILTIILILRPIVTFFIVKAARYPSYVAFTVAVAIAQIGEYSFILAEEGSRLNLLPDSAYDMIIACAFISIALNPLLFQLFKSLINKRRRFATNGDVSVDQTSLRLKNNDQYSESTLKRVVVVGYGPVGRSIATHLSKNHLVIVVNQNIDTAVPSKKKNIEMVYGDATQLHILERINLDQINLIVITTPDSYITQSIIEIAQHLNPNIEIVARLHFKSDYDRAKFGNIMVVCDEEAASEKIVQALGNR